jgi:A118 family predicted phage portal protein
MALPAPGSPWPSKPYDIALRQQAIWSAWLEGDVEKLAFVYGAAAPVPLRSDFSSREGGVFPAIARFFWGRPSVTGQRRHKLHVPLAADIATASADLLFSEPPQFVAGQGKGASQERVDECFNQGDFHSRLLEAAELAAGLGGCFLRLAWDTELFDWVIVEPVDADAGLAEWQWGKLSAVTFFTEVAQDKQNNYVLRHLERHEPGWVLHGLYRGTASSLGQLVPLEEHPSTAPLASIVGEENAIATGVKGLTVSYAANMRPQKAWRKIEMLSDLGRSDFDGPVMLLMDALDECYTSWMRDLRLAKARLLVPEQYLKNLGKGKGAVFDEDQEIFTQLNMLAEEDKGAPQITPQQFEIRTEQHKATADQLIDHILDTAGYSPSTFGRGGEGDKTATEVVSRERKSARTRDKKTRYFSQAFGILDTWGELDRIIYGKGSREPMSVVWPDAVQPDPEALARTMQTLRTAEAASTLVLVRMQHPDWEEDKITEEVERIQNESGRRVPEMAPFGGA